MSDPAPRYRFLRWLLIGIAALAVFAVLAAHLPAGVKKIGLFSLGCGALAGYGLGLLGQKLEIGKSPWVLGSVFLLITLAQGGMVLELFRIWKTSQNLPPMYTPEELLTKERLERPAENESAEDRAIREAALQELLDNADQRRKILEDQQRFSWFLREYFPHRLSPLKKDWSFGASVAFWGIEVLLASLLGTFLARPQFNVDAPAQAG